MLPQAVVVVVLQDKGLVLNLVQVFVQPPCLVYVKIWWRNCSGAAKNGDVRAPRIGPLYLLDGSRLCLSGVGSQPMPENGDNNVCLLNELLVQRFLRAYAVLRGCVRAQ